MIKLEYRQSESLSYSISKNSIMVGLYLFSRIVLLTKVFKTNHHPPSQNKFFFKYIYREDEDVDNETSLIYN